MSKIVYYKDENIDLQYECSGGYVIPHCIISEWKPSVLKTSYKVFGRFLEDMKRAGFKRVLSLTPSPKFAKVFGGVFMDKFIIDNKEVEMFLWELA